MQGTKEPKDTTISLAALAVRRHNYMKAVYSDDCAVCGKRDNPLHHPKPQTPKQAAYLFFLRNAGYSYDPKTQTPRQGRSETARKLAKAERDARALGYSFEWEDDWSVGDHQKEFDCYADGVPETCESCLMRDPAGKVVQSLGCVDDATREYRRVVEAELALEELG